MGVPQRQRDQAALQTAADQHVIESVVGNSSDVIVIRYCARHELPSTPIAYRWVHNCFRSQVSPSCKKMCGTAIAASPMNVIRKPALRLRFCREKPPSHQPAAKTNATAVIDIGATEARKGPSFNDSSRRKRRSPNNECQKQK